MGYLRAKSQNSSDKKREIAFEKEVVENWAAYCIYESTGVGYLSVSLELPG